MSWIKTSLQTLLVCIVVLVGIELGLSSLLNYKDITLGDTSCKLSDPEDGFSVYKPNCRLFHKNWEQLEGVEYKFNEFGRRDGVQNEGEELIAFVGDSFTLGAMVDIEENYNYRSLYYYGEEKLAGHNYGVGGEQFHNIISKLQKLDFSSYTYIVYGLTPNDFFDLVDGSAGKKVELSIANDGKNLINHVKNFLLSSAIAKFLLHNLMSIDSAYYNTYTARQPYAGYLESPISTRFESAIKTAFSQFSELDENIRQKLVLVLLPQRAEVVAAKLGLYNTDFRESILSSCKKLNMTCFATNVEPLAKLDESHFPIDGHLTAAGNDEVALQLADNFRKLRF